MAQYLTPGVYVEEVSFRAPSIEGVGTSTAAFAGMTLTGPVNQTPELLTSFGDFQNIYGGYDNLAIDTSGKIPSKNTNYLALSVKAFFDNGGSQLYVSRVFVPGSGTNTGFATGGATGVALAARFPGAYGNQSITVALKAVRAQTVSGLPSGSLIATVPPGAASIATLAVAAAAADTQITVSPALTGAAPAYVAVDSEVFAVTALDTTNTKLTVTRGAESSTPAAHALGAQVYAPVGALAAAVAATDTTLTLSVPLSGILPAGSMPQFLQVDEEVIGLTAVDFTGTKLTITRGAKSTAAAAHGINAPVFAPVAPTFYTNGSTGTFSSGGTALPSPTPAGLYVLTMSVTANGASGSPQVYDGLGFDVAHPNYLGTALAQIRRATSMRSKTRLRSRSRA